MGSWDSNSTSWFEVLHAEDCSKQDDATEDSSFSTDLQESHELSSWIHL